MKVQLIAPQYVTNGSSAILFCNHTVRDDNLHKIEFMKDEKRIFEYVKERKPPYIYRKRIDGAILEVSKNIFMNFCDSFFSFPFFFFF